MVGDRELLGRLADGELGELLRMLDGSDIQELELELAGTRLYFRRDPGEARADGSDAGAEPASPAAEQTEAVVAERVGFFHHQSEKAGPLQAGDSVTAGQTIGVIDSLNVPIPVLAPRSGAVEEVLVEEGQPVEYGQRLFLIRPQEGQQPA